MSHSPLRYPEDRHVHPWPTGEDLLDRETPCARVWIPDSPLLVLGNSQSPDVELDLEAARADGVPVYQRKGGGGAVYLDGGCVCVALRFRRDKALGISDYFGTGNGLLRRAFDEAFGITAETRGISDLAFTEERHGRILERKLVGSSLHLPRDCGIYLASILVEADLGRLDRYLRHPSREPGYREGRPHAEFVANLSSLSAAATPRAVKQALEAGVEKPEVRGMLDL